MWFIDKTCISKLKLERMGEIVNVTVKDFILTNNNTNVKWKINGIMFFPIETIPYELLEKNVSYWTVNQWEGIIEIATGFHQ